MSLCLSCHIELPEDWEGDRCEDRKACRRRLDARLKDALSRTAAQSRFVGFDPDKAYKEQMGR